MYLVTWRVVSGQGFTNAIVRTRWVQQLLFDVVLLQGLRYILAIIQ
jgi:hypothetical protein